ncbi:MAG: LiaF transmembrane domain-containing protein [bacterium]
MNFGKLNFGLLLISAGIIFFMVNAGTLDHSIWPDLWRFWPVFLITWGLEILFHKSKLWVFTLLSPLILMAVVWGVVYSHMHGEEGLPGLPQATRRIANKHEVFAVDANKDIKRLKVKTDFAGGTLEVGAYDGADKALNAEFEFRGKAPEHIATLKAGVETVEISMPGGLNNYQKKWRIELSRSLPAEFEVEADVSSATLDFTGVPVENLDVKSDVASLNLTLGERPGITNVRLKADIARAKIHIPNTCGLRIRSQSDISSTNLKDLDLKKSGDTWESEGFEKAACRLTFDINADISSVIFSRE